MNLELEVLAGDFAVAQLSPQAPWPEPAEDSEFFSLTVTPDELSVVCPEDRVPKGALCEYGWRCLKVKGPLDFSLTGILASLAAPLASADITIFSVSTFDTDYILVKRRDLAKAVRALKEAGNHVSGFEADPPEGRED